MSIDRTPEDFFVIKGVSRPQLSPDGTRIAFVVSRADLETNQRHSAIYLLPVQGGRPRQTTLGERNDSTPRWSPDSSLIAFTSKSQLFSSTSPAALPGSSPTSKPG